MRFQISASLLDALRARRREQREARAGARNARLNRPVIARGLIGTLQDLFWPASRKIARVADAFVAAMDQCQDEVEAEMDAFLLDPGFGPMTYLTGDGRVFLDMRGWDGEPMREASEDEAITRSWSARRSARSASCWI